MADLKPVVLQEDEHTGDRFLVYGTDKGIRIEIRYDGDTLWMTQQQMAELFGVGTAAISKHISNIYEEGELDHRQLFPKWKWFEWKAVGRSRERSKISISI